MNLKLEYIDNGTKKPLILKYYNNRRKERMEYIRGKNIYYISENYISKKNINNVCCLL